MEFTLPAMDAAILSPVEALHGPAAILRSFLSMVWHEHDYIRETDAATLTSTLIGLVGLAFRCNENQPEFSSYAIARHYARISKLLSAELTDPDLSATMVADRLGISVSYLHIILAKANTTFGKLVMERRLERCRAALADPNKSHLSITTIAFEHGFQELSHFSRRFRDRYQLSPRAFRNLLAK